MRMRPALWAGLLLGCAIAPALAQRSGNQGAQADLLSRAAALLVAAEATPQAAARAAIIQELDAMGVRAIEGAGDDPLAGWRAELVASAAEPLPVWRGRTLGPAYRRVELAAGAAIEIEQIFYAGERAEMAAQARAGGNVAVAVADPRDEKVCEAELTPSARCRWMPIFTERFSIRLENKGPAPASIYLVFR